MAGVLAELVQRDLVAVSTDREALAAALSAGQVTFYCGFDPTAPSLHIGNLVQLLTMRRLQDAGHRPIVVVGGSTGLIGDPKPTAQRALNAPEMVREWSERVHAQVGRYLRFDGPAAASVVNNLDWTAPLSALEFLRDIGQHVRVNKMLAREAVAARLASEGGINYTEFSYQVLQALDYLHLFRAHGCTLQLGGSDQWGNITAGVDLVHRVAATAVHALSTPLVTKADGTKYGKTEGGSVWLDPNLTSPYAFYQFWVNVSDADVVRLLGYYTFLEQAELDRLARAVADRPSGREAQRALAAEVTTLVHGAAAAAQVQRAAAALFGRADLADIDHGVLDAALATVPSVRLAVGDRPTVAELFVATGLAPSLSAARRTVAEGGASINNTRVDDAGALFDRGQALGTGWAILRRGRRAVAAVRVGERAPMGQPTRVGGPGRPPAGPLATNSAPRSGGSDPAPAGAGSSAGAGI